MKPKGFAAMTPERRIEIARMGAKKSPGNFKYDKNRARIAGRAGGLKSKRGPRK